MASEEVFSSVILVELVCGLTETVALIWIDVKFGVAASCSYTLREYPALAHRHDGIHFTVHDQKWSACESICVV